MKVCEYGAPTVPLKLHCAAALPIPSSRPSASSTRSQTDRAREERAPHVVCSIRIPCMPRRRKGEAERILHVTAFLARAAEAIRRKSF